MERGLTNNILIEWHNTRLRPDELQEDKITEITAGPKQVCLLRRGNDVFAFTAKCPHAGAPLCEGWTDAKGEVVCPLHKYRFNPATGHNTTGEGYRLFRYKVAVEDNQIQVGW